MKTQNQIWPIVRLHQAIVDIQPGFAQRPTIENVGTPQLRTNNVSPQGNIDLTDVINVSVSPAEFQKYAVRKGDVIFNNTNSVEWVGKTAYFDIDGDYVLSNHMTRIRVNASMLDPEFLARYLHYLWQTRQSGSRAKQWVNQAAIDQTMLAEYEIPLPSLPEQRRIVAILRHADRLRQLRREADEKAEQLLPALFYEMFGPGVAEREGWPITTISRLGEIQYGFTIDGSRQRYPDKYPYLRVANVARWKLDLSEIAMMGATEIEVKKYSLLHGDVLVVEGHADAYQIGRAAVWKNELPICLHQNHLLRIRPNLGKVTSNYLAGWINSSTGREYMLRYAKTSSGLNTINSAVLANMPVVNAPLDLQLKFEHRYSTYGQTVSNYEESINKIDTLFQSLLAQAFSGELTAVWREEHEGLESLNINDMSSVDTLEVSSGIRAKGYVQLENSLYPVDSIEIRSVPLTRLSEDLSDEQQEVLGLINNSKGYCTVETLKANSELPLYVIRQGLQLLTQVGLVQAVQLPDRPIRSVVYVPAYRALGETDQVRELELGLLRNELEKGLIL